MHVVYPSVKQAMGVDWAALGTRAPPFYAALQLLCDMQTAPDAAGTDLDGQLQWLEQQRLAKLQAAKRPANIGESFAARGEAVEHARTQANRRAEENIHRRHPTKMTAFAD